MKTQTSVTTCYSREHSPVGEDYATEHLFPEGSEVAQQEQASVEVKHDKDQVAPGKLCLDFGIRCTFK